MEGPRLVCDPMGVGSCVLRVPWYVFCCLECKNIAYIVDFLRWADLPPPLLIKDSETPGWWGLNKIFTQSSPHTKIFCRMEFGFWIELDLDFQALKSKDLNEKIKTNLCFELGWALAKKKIAQCVCSVFVCLVWLFVWFCRSVQVVNGVLKAIVKGLVCLLMIISLV